MNKNSDFEMVFMRLKEIFLPYADSLVVKCDDADEFHLNTHFIMKNKKPMYFGSAKVNKNYVSFHLMPVYVFPDLLNNMSPELKKRMQGKSCFNFKSIDKGLFQELAQLTKNGYIRYKESGYT